MIVSVKNQTNLSISALGLNPNENKIIFYNKTFWIKKELIYQHIKSGEIVFIDENNEIVVTNTIGEDILGHYVTFFDNNFGSSAQNIEKFNHSLEDAIFNDIRKLLKNIFRKANVANYTIETLIDKLNSVIFFDLIAFGAYTKAGNAIASIPDDNWFTAQRKVKIKALLDSIQVN